jgi:predicted site-specific integrase-resolvase
MHSTQSTAYVADLWTPAQTSQELSVSLRTLATWRSTGRHNLPFVKVGRLVRYRQPDVAQWLESRLHLSASQEGAA